MVETVSEMQMSGGTQFQKLRAGQLKALHPMIVKLADRAKSWSAEEDRRVQKGVLMLISLE